MREPRTVKEARRKERRRTKKERRRERRERERAARCAFDHLAAAPTERPRTTDHLTGCPVYKGLIVPHIVGTDENGRPTFARLSSEKLARCNKRGLCSVCGKRIGDDDGNPDGWFITRRMNDGNVYSLEPGMHFECMFYALQHCPHLARDGGSRVFRAPAYQIVPFPPGVESPTKTPLEPGTLVLKLIEPQEYIYLADFDGSPALILMSDVVRAARAAGQERIEVQVLRFGVAA